VLVSHEMIGRLLLKHLGVAEVLDLSQPPSVIYRVRPGGRFDRLENAG
jgi:probable phosphoglycerate mutase